ncbi:hypothetical protein BDSB_16705 [Burkholderia dolosa PC543]|nr:hypothetical protein BDSB_16705 [Burkholderia dolosa PC543]
MRDPTRRAQRRARRIRAAYARAQVQEFRTPFPARDAAVRASQPVRRSDPARTTTR